MIRRNIPLTIRHNLPNMNTYNANQPTGVPATNASRVAGNTAFTGKNTTGIGADQAAILASHPSTGPARNTAGPHRYDWANRLDPRIDSDLSNASTAANIGPGGARVPIAAPVGNTGLGIGPNVGIGAPVGAAGYSGGTAAPVAAQGNNYTTGSGGAANGPHRSRIANALDPSVDSAPRSVAVPAAYGAQGGTADMPGPAPNTVGPHRTDVMNNLDPTVVSRPGGGAIGGSGAPAL